MILRVNNNKA